LGSMSRRISRRSSFHAMTPTPRWFVFRCRLCGWSRV